MSKTPDEMLSGKQAARQTAKVILVSSVMFTFISYWRAAAVVLCDLASTSYYIGGIVEHSIGPAAPVFIIAVMLFSYAVRAIYIESCAMFVRGGVYRIVKEALGGMFAKLAASALMFDYILTGPISSVSAGQYIMGLLFELIRYAGWGTLDPALQGSLRAWGSVLIAIVITLYFFRQNILGIHESSEKALNIMILTTIMGVIIIGWSVLTLVVQGPRNSLAWLPDYHAQAHAVGHSSALGFLSGTSWGNSIIQLGDGVNWWSFIGFLGFFIAFGHSILAMSGEETLAQVYREVESPKLKNFQKAAFVVFMYSLILTGTISVLAVLLIPNSERMSVYADNLIGGLSMSVVGPLYARLLLNAFVVVVGALILAGAVNTSMIGSNGVLNRIAEDGVLPESFLKPHPRYGTTHRLLLMIVGLQLFTIVASRGDVLILGEAYAFGVVWSFVFNSLAMLILRFKRPEAREFRVPLNVTIAGREIPIGLGLIFLILICSAIMNLLTKSLATQWGLSFTAILFVTFTITEWIHHRRNRHKGDQQAVLQFNQETQEEVNSENLKLTHQYRKLVAIRSPQNLHTLKKALAETDPETTDVVVMTAKVLPAEEEQNSGTLDRYDQELMTAVVEHAELAGKQVTPLVVPTNSPLFAVLKTAKELGAQEVIMGASNKYSADQQLDQLSFYWINLHQGSPPPLTIRIVSRNRDIYLDVEGGNRIPKISERQARSVAELRAAEVGVDHVLLVHDTTQNSSALFQSVITMLDPQVTLDVVEIPPGDRGTAASESRSMLVLDAEQAERIGREIQLHQALKNPVQEILELINEAGTIDLVIVGLPPAVPGGTSATVPDWVEQLLPQLPCQIFLAAPPPIPHEIVG